MVEARSVNVKKTTATVLATKIRLENGNDHRMEKKKEMTAVRSERKLLRSKLETGGNKKQVQYSWLAIRNGE